MMTDYDFTLTFKFNNPNVNPESYLDLFYEAGCDDALIGIGKTGYMSFNFIRESSSAFEAISTAINNVQSVINDVELINISPDLVGVKELSNVFQCTRQNIQKFVSKDNFPDSIYKGSQSIWHLATVLDWFVANTNYQINPALLELSELAMSINWNIENKAAKPSILEQAKKLVLN